MLCGLQMNITEVEYDLDDDIHYCHRCDICFVSDMHLQSVSLSLLP